MTKQTENKNIKTENQCPLTGKVLKINGVKVYQHSDSTMRQLLWNFSGTTSDPSILSEIKHDYESNGYMIVFTMGDGNYLYWTSKLSTPR